MYSVSPFSPLSLYASFLQQQRGHTFSAFLANKHGIKEVAEPVLIIQIKNSNLLTTFGNWSDFISVTILQSYSTDLNNMIKQSFDII